jgi:1,5-anhydro-D-fructose reductase (1,5-anhydro-D-mannitol-forming)
MRWGILGAGEIAGRGMAPALNRAADTRLVAAYNRSMDKAQAFCAKFNAQRPYDSIERMLADSDVDAVYIATPNHLHAEHAIAAARAGKHILCEKPMANSVADGERMMEAAAKHNVKLAVVFQNRYHAAHAEARRHIASGALGEIQLASATHCRGFGRGGHWSGWRIDPAMAGSGAIVAQAVHPVDLLRFLIGAEVVEVEAMTDEAPPERPVEEMVYSLLRFGNGVHANVVSGTLVPRYDNDILFYGSNAKITCKGTLGVPLNGRDGELTLESDAHAETKHYATSSVADKMKDLIEDYTSHITRNTPFGLTGENGLQMVRIAVAMQEASRTRKAVRTG